MVMLPDLGEDGRILVSQLEDRLVVWLELLFDVAIGCGPLIVVEGMVKNFRLENARHGHTFVKEINHILFKKMGVDVRILVLHDVVNHHVD